MYRPEGWKNPNEEYHNVCDIPTVQDAEYEAFEAGADAMLLHVISLVKKSAPGSKLLEVLSNPVPNC